MRPVRLVETVAAQPSPVPFQPYRRAQADAERDMASILEATAKAIQKRIRSLPLGIGGEVRKAQLTATLSAVKRMQHSMWTGGVNPRVKQGVDDAEKAAESSIEAMTRVAYASLPDAAAEALVRGLRASAESGLKSDAARRKRELSTRVYHQAALHEGKVEDLIRQGIISNLSAKELADSVYKHVSPTTPGGSSYAAMRLARTEINNAFHERQIAGATRPGVTAVKWNLSGSHRVPDLCNVYASHDKGSGQWPIDEVPEKPHPQCFCYLTYITASPDEFQKRLAAGSFDDEIDRRTRENMALAGQKVGPLTAKTPEPVKSIAPIKKTTPKAKAVTKKEPEFDQKGYKPKAWNKVVDNQEEIDSMMESIRTLMPKDKQKEAEEKDGPEWLHMLAESFVTGASEDDEVRYSNGPHRIRFSGTFAGDLKAQQQFLADFDFMQTSYPTGHNMRISVAPSSQFGRGVGGETTISTGSMFINERYLGRDQPWDGMPISSEFSASQYILAHEWGHSLSTKDEADEADTHNHAIKAGGMTKYGTADHGGNLTPREGYAEAFAEWALSKGKTKNPATLVYAKKFNWGERFGLD